MAKKLLLDILVKVLGEFVELNEDNLDLNLAVWRGRITFHNLKLKTDKLLRNIDLAIHHGEIKSLDVSIPWTALLNSPVQIIVDGLFLQVGPLNVAMLDKEETKKRILSVKMQKLRFADKFIDYHSIDGVMHEDLNGEGVDTKNQSKKPSSKSQMTFIQQLTAKIVDNLEITLRNVHIRYEDSQSVPGKVYQYSHISIVS